MKKIFLLLVCMLMCCAAAFSQSVTLAFTAKDESNQWVQFDRVSISNLTKGWQWDIYWPDTTLTMQNNMGIGNIETSHETSLQLSQNKPNPFTGTTEVSLTVAEDGEIAMEISDIVGRVLETWSIASLQTGTHQFCISLAATGTYLMIARQKGQVSSIKMVCNGGGNGNRIEYIGNGGEASHVSATQAKNGPKYTTNLPFNFGDQMKYVGYANINGMEVESEHIIQMPNASQTITLYFIQDGQPCRGEATVIDIDGNTYNTVKIGNQCWMKENLRTTRYFDGTTIPLGTDITSTTTAYRYAPGLNQSNEENMDNVSSYGYLYNWAAVMYEAPSSNTIPSRVQGICPNGWHMPSDMEWTQLIDYVYQSQYECDNNSNDIAKSLASIIGWDTCYNACTVGNDISANNATGFSALPAGTYYGLFDYFSHNTSFWSATENVNQYALVRTLSYDRSEVERGFRTKSHGYSVRCVRRSSTDPVLPAIHTNAVSDITLTTAACGGNVTDDGGAIMTARGVCWSTSQNPTVMDSHTINGSEMGFFATSITGLLPNTTYYVRAYATNSMGTAYGNQVSFTTTSYYGQPCPGIATVTDIDGNVYNTVQIGNQCWIKENLRTTRYTDGTSIPLGSMSDTSTTTAYRYYPEGDSTNVPTYGYLYNWPAVMNGSHSSNSSPSGVQGICPNGWNVPSDAEWTQLIDYVGSQSQYQCNNNRTKIAKALASTIWWDTLYTDICDVGNNPSTNNATGFSALPAGNYRFFSHSIHEQASFWSATEESDRLVNVRTLMHDESNVERYRHFMFYGHSVRCLRSEGMPVVSTDTIGDITLITATCGGTVISDGGNIVTARGICWSTLQNPTIADAHTTNGSGVGYFSCSMTGLIPGTVYYVRAYATNSIGTAYGGQVIFAVPNPNDGQPCLGADSLTDIDNNIYNTVRIGSQCWMKENLRTTRYANGNTIPLGTATNTTTPSRFYPHNDSLYVPTYGYLYNGVAVMNGASASNTNPSGVQGICPNGWHVPSNEEWIQLTNYVGRLPYYQCDNNSRYIAKALASTMGWNTSSEVCAIGNDPSLNNMTGFSALPAGLGSYDGDGFGSGAFFWTTTKDDEHEDDDNISYFIWWLAYNVEFIYMEDPLYINQYFSVRCVHDEWMPAVSTNAVSDITSTTATCGGNVTDGGGVALVTCGVCWSTSPNPTVLDSHTTDISGMGNFTSSLSGLFPNTTYYVRAYVTNSQGTSYGNEINFTTVGVGRPCPGSFTVTDIDDNIYNTVQIGNQCWMKENLRTTRYANGIAIPYGTGTSTTTPYRYYPNGDSTNVPIYGYLYNWKAVMNTDSSSIANPSGVQGICPTGWHVPSDAEWTQLTNHVSSQPYCYCNSNSAYIAKALASTAWTSTSTIDCAVGNDPSVNNMTGFSALPAGIYYGFSDFGIVTDFWSATESSDCCAYRRFFSNSSAHVVRISSDKNIGRSVRCLRDTISVGGMLTVTTNAVSNITFTTAICGGNVTDDGGDTVTLRGVCWSTSQYPTIDDNHTADGSGIGSFSSSITGLSPGTAYYVRAYAINDVGMDYGSQIKFFTPGINDGQPCLGAATLTDIDNNIYNTVQIGNQCWMKENLRTTRYANGASIPMGSTNNHNITDPYRYAPNPNNDSSNVSNYGYLYNWPAVMYWSDGSSNNPSGVQGICPIGWHIPSDAEWIQLIEYVGSQTQYKCDDNSSNIAKALASTTGWSSSSSNTCVVGNNASTNNATGFSALPAGYYHYVGSYDYFSGTRFWSATEINSAGAAYNCHLDRNNAFVEMGYWTKSGGSSVRCLRDITSEVDGTSAIVITDTVSDVTSTTVTCGGNVIDDGGDTVTSRGVCWSPFQNPTISDDHTTDGSGIGSFSSSITGLIPCSSYYVRAYATNGMGTYYGSQVKFFTPGINDGQPCIGTAALTDIDSNTYNTVQIGNQCWMKENLRTTRYANGTTIPLGTSTSTTTPYRYYPNDDSSNVSTYGYLYNWPAVMQGASSSSTNPSGVQGICPTGWHVPSDSEWVQLFNYVSNLNQYKCDNNSNNIAKALASTTGWNTSLTPCGVGDDQSNNNATGFSALPAGAYYYDYIDFGNRAIFWSTWGTNNGLAYRCYLSFLNTSVTGYGSEMFSGCSVRCVRD